MIALVFCTQHLFASIRQRRERPLKERYSSKFIYLNIFYLACSSDQIYKLTIKTATLIGKCMTFLTFPEIIDFKNEFD